MFVIVIVGFMAKFVAATDLAAQSPCTRPPARQIVQGATIVLNETKVFPCTVRVVPTGVELRAAVDKNVEEIGAFVTRSPDGRFFTSRDAAGQVTVWNRDGSFVRNIGRLGQGPGEFAAGPKFIKFDAQGRMYVGDNSPRWAIFDAAFNAIGNVSARDFGIGLHNCCAILDDGTFLTSYGRQNGSFRIIDINNRKSAAPQEVRAFGPAATVQGATRAIAYASGNTFWAGPSTRVPFEYTLDLWRTDGVRLRTIRRTVPWISSSAPSVGAAATPPPEMQVFHDDGTGLLYVSIMIPGKAFAKLTAAERRDWRPGGASDKSVDNYFEVIDVNAGVVLASIGPMPPSEAVKRIPNGFFRQSRQGFQRQEDANGFPTMLIVESKLVAK